LGSTGASAAPPSISLAAYVSRLDQALAAAEAGLAHPAPDALDRVRATVGAPLLVRLPDGHDVSIPSDPVLDRSAGAGAGDFRAVVFELRALRAAARQAGLKRPPDSATLRAQLAAAYRDVNPRPGIVDRIRTVVRQMLG